MTLNEFCFQMKDMSMIIDYNQTRVALGDLIIILDPQIFILD